MQYSDNILITGITSIHGWPIFSLFRQRYGNRVYGVCSDKMSSFFEKDKHVFFCDIEDYNGMKNIFKKVCPEAVLHAGGVCDLDMCEDSPDFAYEVNVKGAGNIAELSKGKYLLYISSDLVFSGNDPLDEGYIETSIPDPVSVVGQTYVEAENEILKHGMSAVVRIGLPIGPSISGTKGAVDFISKRLKFQKKMTLFFDEIRSMVTTEDLSAGILSFFKKKEQGLFHFGGPRDYSLYDIGLYLVETRDYHKEFLIRSSRFEEENGPPRIGNVRLNSKKFCNFLGFEPMDALYPWKSIDTIFFAV